MASRWRLLFGITLFVLPAAATAQMSTDESARLKADAEARTADSNADKAEWEAKKSAAEAQAAIAKAHMGELLNVPESSTTASNNAGTIEATVLAYGEAREAAKLIVGQICGEAPTLCAPRVASPPQTPAVTACTALAPVLGAQPKLYIYGESEKPVFDAAETVQAALCGVRRRLQAAIDASESGDQTRTAGPAAIFTIASTAAKLLRTDYALSGLTVSTDDLLLAKLVMAENSNLGASIPRNKILAPIHIPALFKVSAYSDQAPLMKAMIELQERRDQAATLSADHKRKAKTAGKQKARADRENGFAAALDAAIKSYDDYVGKITTVSEKGVTELAEAARQSQVRQDLASGSYLLVVKMNAAGGSGYTKKNVATFFGGPAFFVSGGAETSYALYAGATGETLRADEFGSVSDFKRIGKVVR